MGQPVGLALVLLTALAGCAAKPDATPGTDPKPPETTATTVPEGVAELAAALEAIDPQPPAPLHTTAPARTLMPEPKDQGPADPKDVDFAMDHWQRHDDGVLAERVAYVLLVLNLAINAEVHQPKDDAGRCARLFALERLYGALDRPHLAAGATWPVVEAIAKLEGVGGTQEQNETLAELMITSVKISGGLYRRSVAEILKTCPTDPQTPAVLDRLAEKLQDGERTELAGDARDAALSLRGFAAQPKDR